MGLLRGLRNLVFCPRCLGCNQAVGDGGELVCGRCRSRLTPPPPPLCPRCGFPRLRTGRAATPTCQECRHWPVGLRAARSACLLKEPADALVYQLKYRGWQRLAEPMGQRLADVQLPHDVAVEARRVVPVPTTRLRLRERGYNQAEVLARAFARRTGRIVICSLRRTAGTRSQIALQPAARLANVAGAFGLMAGSEPEIARQHLLLVDDVLTTGATATACARVLIDGGARCVSILTFARAIGRLRLD